MESCHRSVLITGCSTGIGFAAARDLRARGWQVIATARKSADLDRLKSMGFDAVHLELTDSESIAACSALALDLTGGKLGALFSNAAYGQVGAIEDLEVEVMRTQFEVNVFGLHDLTRRLIPAMRANRCGRIINCSSVLGLMAAPYRGAYCATKFALEAISDSLRMELHGTGISVSLIEPGPIRTEFLPTAIRLFRENVDITASAHAEIYRRRLQGMEAGGKATFKLEPEAVVKRLVHALESPRPKPRYFVTVPTYGANILKRLLPTVMLDRFARSQ